MNQSWIEERAADYRDQVALKDTDTGQTIRYNELPGLLSRQAREIGEFWPARKENSVNRSLWLTRKPTSLPHALELMAAARAGCTVLPLSPRWKSARVGEVLRSWGMAEVIEELLANGAAKIADVEIPHGTLLASSGSTGAPKLVFHPWSAHIANAEGAAARIPLGPGDCWEINLPLWHTSGFAALFRTLHAGATAVFGSQRDRITHCSAVATQLWRAVRAEGARSLCGMRAVLAGGGPVSAALRAELLQAGVPLHVTYGLTEAASQVCTTGQLTLPEPEICGAPLPGREVRITEDGEIQIRGAVLAQRVWEGTTRTLQPIPLTLDGWLPTGDFGAFTDSGELLVHGRRDRMFVCAGENLHPERIEQALLSLPGVRNAVVVGMPDAEFGHVPVAIVEGEGGTELWKEQLGETLSGLEIPRNWFVWPQELLVSAIKPSPKEIQALLDSARLSPCPK